MPVAFSIQAEVIDGVAVAPSYDVAPGVAAQTRGRRCQPHLGGFFEKRSSTVTR
jgi:hypothetical protein